MRFPHQADLRILAVSPISDGDIRDQNPGLSSVLQLSCFAATTSGTFDPDLQFEGQSIGSGSFGQLVDIWISRERHRRLINEIDGFGINFSAPVQLRLFNILTLGAKVQPEQNILYDPVSFNQREFRGLPRGFPLSATRMFPSMTALTFDIRRIGV